MQKSIKLKLLLTFLGIGAGIFLWQTYNVDVAPVVAAKSRSAKEVEFLSMPKEYTAQTSSDNVKSLPQQSSTVHPLHTALVNAKDLRVLSEKLKSQPELGGLYYASLINQRCSSVRDDLLLTHATDSNASHDLASRSENSFNKLRSQCAGFLDAELSVDQLGAMLKSEKDPLLTVIKQLGKSRESGTSDEKKLALVALMDTHSPEAITARVIEYSKDGAYFDGTTYAVGSKGDAVLLNAAVALAECKLGASCDVNDFAVINACAAELICADSKEDLVKQRILSTRKDPASDMQKISLLATKIVTAIQTHDVDKFIRK